MFEMMTVDGVDLELVREGSGPKLLLLQGVRGIEPELPYFRSLVQHFEVFAPSHPGFGRSSLPSEFRAVSDLVQFYATFLDEIGFDSGILVGCSFGGWIAAEMATRYSKRFSRLILSDAVGIRISGPETPDIADIYQMDEDQYAAACFAVPEAGYRDYAQMAQDDLLAFARSREAQAFFGWKPYMHDPSLKRWLRRIESPALMLWGEQDRIVTPEYGRAFAAEIPKAVFQAIPGAGHYPHIEQPDAFVGAIKNFCRAPASA